MPTLPYSNTRNRRNEHREKIPREELLPFLNFVTLYFFDLKYPAITKFNIHLSTKEKQQQKKKHHTINELYAETSKTRISIDPIVAFNSNNVDTNKSTNLHNRK